MAVDDGLVTGVVAATLDHVQVAGTVELTVRLTDDEALRELNRRYRGRDEPTDVLSFSALEGGDQFVLPPDQPRQLGDVVISYERAVQQAAAYGHDLRREIAWLSVHGALQLLGFRHDDPEVEREMREAEESILTAAGLERPGR